MGNKTLAILSQQYLKLLMLF